MKPIIFSTEMVKAIEEGRKTQTRRVIKPQTEGATAKPHYKAGDILYVRESFAPVVGGGYLYKADPIYRDCGVGVIDWDWKPSIHMPRAAARIFLRVTDVKVERLQNISYEDARAEGIVDGGCLSCGNNEPCGCDNPRPDPVDGFLGLWNKIHEKHPEYQFVYDPWVFVYSFEKIDKLELLEEAK